MEANVQEDWWQAVLSRNNHLDGTFVYGVRSTGIYCRPSCSARGPRRDQVVFFRMAEAAEQAGFRPCRRYRPAEAVIQDPQGKKKHSICQFCFLLPIGLLPLMAPWRESESISISSQDDWNI